MPSRGLELVSVGKNNRHTLHHPGTEAVLAGQSSSARAISVPTCLEDERWLRVHAIE